MVATAMGKRVGDAGNGTPPDEFQFEFHAPHMQVPADLMGYTHDKLAAKLHKFHGRVIGVRVWLRDTNGTKGGVDKFCRMEAMLAGLEPVNVEETDADVRAVIDLAIDRFERAVQRHIERVGSKVSRERKVQRGRKAAKIT